MKYYSTQRPVMPGSYPKEGVVEIENFDERTLCKEIGREAWGYIEYDRELTEAETRDYELTPEGIEYWGVTVASKKQGGGLKARIENKPVRATEQPQDERWEDKSREYKRHWFSTLEEAQRALEVLESMEITIERVRGSVTQGEVRTYVNGQYILNWGDKIELIHEGEEFYGAEIGGWASKQPDSGFALGLIWHPFDYMYHYSDKVKKALGIEE